MKLLASISTKEIPSFERILITKVLETGDLRTVIKRKIHADHFMLPEMRVAFNFIIKHYQKFGAVPSTELFQAQFRSFKLRTTTDTLDAICGQLRTTKLYTDMADMMDEAIRLNRDDPFDALDHIRSKLTSLTSQHVVTRDADLTKETAEAKAEYERVKAGAGILGVPWPWEKLNEVTLGVQRGEVVYFYARPKAGKTWLLVKSAVHAFKMGRRPLLISKEMPTDQIRRRVHACFTGVDYNAVRTGRLSPKDEKHYFEDLEAFSENDPFILSGDDEDKGGVMSVTAKIKEYDPDIVFLDGVYLMHDDRTNKRTSDWQGIAHITQDLKRMAKQLNIPVVGTTQANRAAEKTKGESKSEVAYGDCLAPETLVYSRTQGLVSLRDLDSIGTVFNGKCMKGYHKLATREKELFRVSFSDGSHLDASLDHRVLTYRNHQFTYVRVKHLKHGDVLLQPDRPYGESRLNHTRVKSDDVCRAELLGVLVADGWVNTPKGFTCACGIDEDYARYVKELVLREGINANIREQQRTENHQVQYVVSGWSQELRQYFKKLGLGYVCAHGKDVPRWIMSGSLECRAAFLRGYFSGDGGVDAGMVRAKSVSESLIKNIQQLLLSLGIHSNVSPAEAAWQVYVRRQDNRRFHDYVGFLIPRKQGQLEEYLDGSDSGEAVHGPLAVDLGVALKYAHWPALSRQQQYQVQKMLTQEYVSVSAARRFVKQFQLRQLGLLLVSRFESVQLIEYLRAGEVFDIAMLDTSPRFVANGVLVHNSFAQDADYLIRIIFEKTQQEDHEAIITIPAIREAAGCTFTINAYFAKDFSQKFVAESEEEAEELLATTDEADVV
jgi:replicative DNA helicase